MKRLILSSGLVSCLVFLMTSNALALDQVVFPEKTMTAMPKGAKYSATFQVTHASPTVNGKIIVQNGLGEDLTVRNCDGLRAIPKALCVLENVKTNLKLTLFYPKSFEVVLNNQTVAAHGQFPRTKGLIEIPVTLQAQNALNVTVKGIPTNFIQLKVTAETQAPNLPPLADFTFSPTSGYAPLLVSFSALTSSDPDGTIAQYNWDFGDGQTANGVIVTHNFTAHGQFAVKLTVIDDRGASHSKTISINIYQALPPVAHLALRSPSSGDAPLMALFDSTQSSDPRGQALIYEWNFGDGQTSNQAGLVTHIFENAGSYQVQLKVTNPQGLSDTATVTVTANQVVLPPDPADVAPQISQFEPTTFEDKFDFLYEGANPIQKDVQPGAIDPERISVLRGQILDDNQEPIPGVRVTVLGAGELGYTLSRADGYFDIALNGGGTETLTFEKTGYLPVQRTYNPNYKDFSGTETVLLTALDQKVTTIAANSDQVQIVQGSVSSDDDGERTATLMVPKSTSAQVELPGGGTISLPTLSMRITEFTVGENGPQKMPASLPTYTSYTYAIDITADEALAMGAKHIKFSKPVSVYVDNFLGFRAGTIVPAGVYDYDKGLWLPKPDGRVIKVLSIENNRAVLDVTGTDQPATQDDLSVLNIDDEELQQLAVKYAAGDSFWRVQSDRFSPTDYNWNSFDNTRPPESPKVISPDSPCNCKIKKIGWSTVDTLSQTLRESISIVGTNLNLTYSSDRNRDQVSIPLLLSRSIDPDVERIDLTIDIAGRQFKRSFNPESYLYHEFYWDQKDAYQRPVVTETTANIKVTYVFKANYLTQLYSQYYPGPSFSTFPVAYQYLIYEARDLGTMTTTYSTQVDPIRLPTTEVGGWSLDVHHFFNPDTNTVYFGNGDRMVTSATSLRDDLVATVFAGTGTPGYNGTGIPAKSAQLNGPVSTYASSDGSVYVYESGNHRIRRVRPDGIIENFAGNGIAGYSGDGGLAIEASISNAGTLTMTEGPDNTIYIGDWGNYAIRKIDKNGIITTIAGNGQPGFAGDGGPAQNAQFYNIEALVYKDGSLFVADARNRRIREITPNGIIKTILGDGTIGTSPDGTYANQAKAGYPAGLAFSQNGDLYFTDAAFEIIQKIKRDGTIEIVAGIPSNTGFSGDDGPAKNANLNTPTWLAVLPDNTIIFNDKGNFRLRKIGTDGVIRTIIGNGTNSAAILPNFANAISFKDQRYFSISPTGDLYLAETGTHRVLKIASQFKTTLNDDGTYKVNATDGSEIYIFDRLGTHLKTLNATTGAIKYEFHYLNGRLASIVDGFGNLTQIGHSGQFATEIESPYGQTTTLSYHGNGLLKTLTQPSGDFFEMAYIQDGLLSSFRKPNGAQSSFEYYTDGRLKRDTNALGGFLTISDKTFLSIGTEMVTSIQSTEGRVDRFYQGLSSNGQNNLHYANGRQLLSFEGANAPQVETNANSRYDYQTRIDERLGGAATFQFAKVERQGGVQNDSHRWRRYDRINSLNIFDFDFTEDINENGFFSNLYYSSGNRTYTFISPVGRYSQQQINTQEQPIFLRQGLLNPITMQYDTRGRPYRVSQGDRVTQFIYGSNGLVSEIIDPENRSTKFEYDANLRNTKVVTPGNREIFKSYDANGNLIGVTPEDRSEHELSHNLIDLLISYIPPLLGQDELATSYEYNLDKQLTKISRPNGNDILYVYGNATGLLDQVTTPEGNYNYSYLSNGQLRQITSADNIRMTYEYTGEIPYRFITSGEVNSDIWFGLNNFFNPSAISINGQLMTLGYDNDQLLTRAGAQTMQYNGNGLLSLKTLGTISETYNYNQFGEIIEMAATGSPFQYAVTRDKLGRITEKTESVDGSSESYSYRYDIEGRLYQVYKNSQLKSRYSYDRNNNRLQATVDGLTKAASYDAQDRLLTYGTKSYGYNANGELTSVTDNENGEIKTFSYDSFGNLKLMNTAGKNIQYVLDGQNRRIGKKVNGFLVQSFVYQSQFQIAGEMDSNGNLISRFVYASKAHVPDYMIKNGVNYKLITDQIGSVRLVVNSASGEIMQHISYDEFGNVLEDTSPRFQPFAFAGGLYDQDTKLVHFGARDYDPETGRWISKDPILFAGGDTNLFGYVANDPVNWVDPSGLDRRRCSRRLNSLLIPIKVGRLRHDYAQFRNSNGDVTTKSWGNNGMIDESGIDTSTRSCGDWEKSSDKADKMAQDLADTLNDVMDYGGATGYNCQDYTDNILNFQRGR